MEYIIYEILVFVFILLSAFFSGMETTIISANSIKLRAFSEKGNKKAKMGLYILDNIEDALGMVLIGNNLANVAATAFIVFIATKAFLYDESELLIVTFVQTIVFLIFCEILPKAIARSRNERYLLIFSYPIYVMMLIFKPAVKLSLIFANRLKSILKLESSGYSAIGSRDEIGTLFRMGEKEGLIDRDHHNLITEILSFHEVTANEVMTPTIDIRAIEKKQSVKQLVKLIEETRFSRIPVYEERVDNIVGYIHFKDILKNRGLRKIEDILKKPYYIPSTKKVSRLYVEMQDNKIPVVFVVNEFGGVNGLITIEDIAEEIVGEIQTRDHPEEDLIKKINENKYLLSGYLDIDFFQKQFNLFIDKKGFETLAGFVTYQLGKIPKKGDRFDYGKHTFIVNEATERAVLKVLCVKKTIKGKKKS